MTDHIDAAFRALHDRLDHVMAYSQFQFTNQVDGLGTPEGREAVFREAVRDMGRTTDWLVANPLDQVQARQAELFARASEVLWGGHQVRSYDGLDDVRIPREDGPALGSIEAAQAEHRLEEHRAREADEENPTVLDRVEQLQQRLAATPQFVTQRQEPAQEMER